MTGHFPRRPRLGFLGVGWIGRNRLASLVQSDLAVVAGMVDPVEANIRIAQELAPCPVVNSLEQLLDLDLDGLVIATPSAMHAEQALAALQRGVSVFCQKPLGRTASETAAVVAAARAVDRLLDVDLAYRFVEGARRIRELVQTGELGSVYAADLIFHNAFGPDKAWFYDRSQSGGGCVIDLGIHLVDLALWTMRPGAALRISSSLFAQGKPLSHPFDVVEDYAIAEIGFENRTVARLACSWNLAAGCDAVIQASFYGTAGGASLRNVAGSFYDFAAERYRGTSTERLCSPPEAWGGRAAVDWAQRLAEGSGYDPSVDRIVEVAEIVDGIYQAAHPWDEGLVSRIPAGSAS
jgi:predicted dehydrogenase